MTAYDVYTMPSVSRWNQIGVGTGAFCVGNVGSSELCFLFAGAATGAERRFEADFVGDAVGPRFAAVRPAAANALGRG